MSKQDEFIAALFPDDYIGCAVDVGACDGTFNSNTNLLEKKGWRVLCIEANPHYEEVLHYCRNEVMMVAAGAEDKSECDFHICHKPGNDPLGYASHSSLMKPSVEVQEVAKVTMRTLDTCLKGAKFTSLDLVCIDVEGTEEDVLTGLHIEKWQPRVIVVENWAKNDRYEKYLESYAYKLDKRIAYDEVFVHAV